MSRELGGGHAVLKRRGVRHRTDVVAAQRHEEVHVLIAQLETRAGGGDAVLARDVEAEFSFHVGEEPLRHLLRDTHGAVSLDVGVAAERGRAGARLAVVTREQQEVHHLLDGGHGIAVLRNTQRPREDDGLCLLNVVDDLLHLALGDSGAALEGGIVKRVKVRDGLVDVGAELIEELAVKQVAADHLAVDLLEQRAVAVEADLHVFVADLVRDAQGTLDRLRLLELHEARFRHRVDGDELAAVFLLLLKRSKRTRVVRAGVLAHGDDEVRVVHVLHDDGALAHAHGLGERHTRGVVAEVRAIWQVIGAVAAAQHAKDKRGLVDGRAGGVEDGAVRIRRLELLRDEVVGLVPAHRVVLLVAARAVVEHGLSEAAELVELVVRHLAHLLHGGVREELAGNALGCGLLSDGLRAVLTELDEVDIALRRLRPGAARTVDAAVLVHFEQRHERAVRDGLLHGVVHAAHAGCGGDAVADAWAIEAVGHWISSGDSCNGGHGHSLPTSTGNFGKTQVAV